MDGLRIVSTDDQARFDRGESMVRLDAPTVFGFGGKMSCQFGIHAIGQPASMSDSEVYSQFLAQSWTNYMYFISGQYDMHEHPAEKAPRTVNLEEILPKHIPELVPGVSGEGSLVDSAGLLPQCRHCGTAKTSLWRRKAGLVICNACALYEKLHGTPRPAHLLHQALRRRNRTESVGRKKRR